MKKILLVVVALGIWVAHPVLAVKLNSLYRADLPVGSQTDDERAQAVKQGFAQLLVKLTGNPDIDKNETIGEAIKRADYYVQEFNYSAPTTNSATYLIHISFNRDDVNRLLHKAGITYWGEKRPLILVWLAVTKQQQTAEIIGNETPGPVLDAMRNQGEKFALPLIFPMMDVTDMDQVSPEEVSSMVLPILKQAGKRYSPNGYLIGNIEGKDALFKVIGC